MTEEITICAKCGNEVTETIDKLSNTVNIECKTCKHSITMLNGAKIKKFICLGCKGNTIIISLNLQKIPDICPIEKCSSAEIFEIEQSRKL